jgi:hypothetical protein
MSTALHVVKHSALLQDERLPILWRKATSAAAQNDHSGARGVRCRHILADSSPIAYQTACSHARSSHHLTFAFNNSTALEK